MLLRILCDFHELREKIKINTGLFWGVFGFFLFFLGSNFGKTVANVVSKLGKAESILKKTKHVKV